MWRTLNVRHRIVNDSESKPPHQHALPRIQIEYAAERARRGRQHSPKSGRRVAVRQIRLLELGVCKRSTRRVAPEGTVEYIRELHAEAKGVSLFKPERTAEIHVFA